MSVEEERGNSAPPFVLGQKPTDEQIEPALRQVKTGDPVASDSFMLTLLNLGHVASRLGDEVGEVKLYVLDISLVLHAPNEHYSLTVFAHGIETAIVIMEALANM